MCQLLCADMYILFSQARSHNNYDQELNSCYDELLFLVVMCVCVDHRCVVLVYSVTIVLSNGYSVCMQKDNNYKKL